MTAFWKAWGYALVGWSVVACAAQRSSEVPASTAAPAAPAAPAEESDASASTAGPPGSSEAWEPKTLAEAEAWLERAQVDLDRLALNAAPASGAVPPARAAAPSPPEQTPAPPRAEKRAADAAAEGAGATSAEKPAERPCETACKAFSSLTRASDAVCRLDSEGGQRCQRARQIQTDASRRVASCGCSK